MLYTYTYSVEPDKDFDYITPCNNKYITCITLVIEIRSTPYLVYSTVHAIVMHRKKEVDMQRCYPAFIHGCMFNSPISLLPETHIFLGLALLDMYVVCSWQFSPF